MYIYMYTHSNPHSFISYSYVYIYTENMYTYEVSDRVALWLRLQQGHSLYKCTYNQPWTPKHSAVWHSAGFLGLYAVPAWQEWHEGIFGLVRERRGGRG